MWGGINKRRFPRASLQCSIFIKKKSSTREIHTKTENIGGGGICVILNEDLGLFQAVDLEITMDDGNTPIKCAGTVVWVVKKRPAKKTSAYSYDTGIEFVDIEPSQRERILKKIDLIIKKETRST